MELFHAVSINCFYLVVSRCLDELFSLSCFMLSPSTVFTELFHVVSIYRIHCFTLSRSIVFTMLFHRLFSRTYLSQTGRFIQPTDQGSSLLFIVMSQETCGLRSWQSESWKCAHSFVDSTLVCARSFVIQ